MQKYLICGIVANEKLVYMKRFIISGTLFPLLIMLFVASCGNDQVATDMDEWCECMADARQDPSQEGECFAIRDRIYQKYAFDPDAAEVIRKKVDECEHGLNRP